MKCIRCGEENSSGKICHSCMRNWMDMRNAVFNELESKHGAMTPTNHEIYKKEMKRMEKIWRADKDKFQVEFQKLNSK